MPSIPYYIYRMIISILSLYWITKVYMKHPESTLWKAIWVSLVLALFQYLGGKLIGNPEGFHASMFANIGRFLLIIPAGIAFLIFYRMNLSDYVKVLIGSVILSFVTHPLNLIVLKLLA